MTQSVLVELEKLRLKCQKDSFLVIDPSFPQLVFGKGNETAQIFIIGEAPGAKEAQQGFPFVGSAGKRLNGLLQLVGLTLEDVYITNILKYRPPKNRDPKPSEIALHTPYLQKQIEIIKPKVLLTLGNFATKFVLGGFSVAGMKEVAGVASIHGTIQTITFNGSEYLVLPSYHPAAMMYKPSLRSEIEADFIQMKPYLQSNKQKNLEEFHD